MSGPRLGYQRTFSWDSPPCFIALITARSAKVERLFTQPIRGCRAGFRVATSSEKNHCNRLRLCSKLQVFVANVAAVTRRNTFESIRRNRNGSDIGPRMPAPVERSEVVGWPIMTGCGTRSLRLDPQCTRQPYGQLRDAREPPDSSKGPSANQK